MEDPVEAAGRDFLRSACNGDLEGAERIRAEHPALTVQSLHAAAIYGDERGLDLGLSGEPHKLAEGARRLIAAGADARFAFPDSELPGGIRTALAGACGDPGSLEVCAALLDGGADAHDSTPLGWVTHGSRYSGGAASRREVYVELAELLLAAGAPLPKEGERHGREQHAEAAEEVKAVLARYGWQDGE